MAVKKCINCEAKIPAGSGFCPACGAQIVDEQKKPKSDINPVISKPVKSGQGGFKDLINFITSFKIMVLCLIIAVLVAWITKIIIQYQTTYSSAYDALNIVNFTFMAGIGIILFLGGLFNSKINTYLRTGLIITGGLFLALNL
ncbi:hypothetical protein AYK20_00830 [Thermoplasmatales archaeon SG8-52-1]|nr:MAG: hypothetical protein AYK20_00830 [Thermoplasmatales archaeon SG8-52-1]